MTFAPQQKVRFAGTTSSVALPASARALFRPELGDVGVIVGQKGDFTTAEFPGGRFSVFTSDLLAQPPDVWTHRLRFVAGGPGEVFEVATGEGCAGSGPNPLPPGVGPYEACLRDMRAKHLRRVSRTPRFPWRRRLALLIDPSLREGL